MPRARQVPQGGRFSAGRRLCADFKKRKIWHGGRNLPRKNSFIRPAVANVDLLVLLASCAIPQTEPFLIDRVLAIAGQQGVEPLICVNKNDLEPGASLAGIYERAGFRVIVTSAETGEGMDELHAAISGKLSCLHR